MPNPDRPQLPTGTVTFLFTDIEGLTRLLSALGNQYPPLLGAHDRIIRTSIAEHHGIEVSTEGDAFFAVFPSASDAVSAAVAAQRALAAAQWPDGKTVRVRMGLHSGVGRLSGDDYVGLDVHRAARIASAGHGGQVLLSDATRALIAQDLPDGIGLRDLGEHRLKDLALPMRISQLQVDGLDAEFPELKTLDARPTNLPSQLSSFVGRERELERVKELIGEHRLVILTGAGGTGKTRLAQQVAGELLAAFADGAFFVDLAHIRDPALIPMTVAQALGLAVAPGGDALGAARFHLAGRKLLLILDNFEQVVEGARLIEELLAAAPLLAVLVTSRIALHIYGAQEYEVPPFELPKTEISPEGISQYEAVALFVARARAVRPAFSLSAQNAPAVARLTARLDGLPLAIELAASQVRVLSPQTILSRLDSRLPLSRPQTRGGRSGSGPCAGPSNGATTCWMKSSAASPPGCRSSPAAARSKPPRPCATPVTL